MLELLMSLHKSLTRLPDLNWLILLAGIPIQKRWACLSTVLLSLLAFLTVALELQH